MIEIYGAPWCGWCNKAKSLAAQQGLSYTYFDVDRQHRKDELKQRMAHFFEISPDTKLTIPQIWWDGRYVGGYDAFALEIENLGNYGQGPC